MSFDSSFSQRGRSTPAVHTTTTHITYSASSTSAITAYGVLLLISVYYLLHYLETHHLPLSEFLWNVIVYATPSKMLSLIDTEFFRATLQDPANDEAHTSEGFNSHHHAAKSNSLRRLMGLDSNTGFMMAVQRTRTLSDLGSVFKSKPSNNLPGLGNWDHSCYQNSVIQGLASLESLPNYLDQNQTIIERDNNREGVTRKALRDLTRMLNDEKNLGKTFWTPSELKSMSSWQQQDAQEYFSKIMDGLEKDAAGASNSRYCQMRLATLTRRSSMGDMDPAADNTESTLRTSRMSQLPGELQALMARNPLEGLLAQRVGCQQCGYVEGLSLVPFNCLTVPLGRRRMYDVRECLDEYTELEAISGVECAKCTLDQAKAQLSHMLNQLSKKQSLDAKDNHNDQISGLRGNAQKRLDLVQRALEDEDFSDSVLKKCQIPAKSYVSTTKSRQAVVARAPKALVIHVNRSIFDELSGEQSKNQASVRFPLKFSLGSWCLGTQQENQEANMENWNTNPTQSMLENIPDHPSLNSGPFYELRAVITHYGRHENGHYICYRRSPYTVKVETGLDTSGVDTKGPWWRLSDEEVTEVSEENVLAQGGVFMLFYEQMPPHNRILAADWEAESDVVNNTTTEQSGVVPHRSSRDAQAALVELDPVENTPSKPCVSSIYPTPPPEEVPEAATKPESEKYSQGHPQSSKTTSKPLSDPTAAAPSSAPPTPLSTATTPPNDPEVIEQSSITEKIEKPEPPAVVVAAAAAAQTASSIPPPPSQPISPRTGRGNGRGRRTGKAMESMAGFVQAN